MSKQKTITLSDATVETLNNAVVGLKKAQISLLKDVVLGAQARIEDLEGKPVTRVVNIDLALKQYNQARRLTGMIEIAGDTTSLGENIPVTMSAALGTIQRPDAIKDILRLEEKYPDIIYLPALDNLRKSKPARVELETVLRGTDRPR